jgi:hypothetical protein
LVSAATTAAVTTEGRAEVAGEGQGGGVSYDEACAHHQMGDEGPRRWISLVRCAGDGEQRRSKPAAVVVVEGCGGGDSRAPSPFL